jgi:Gas vesicle synthesis protein GvpL/GvpF
VPRSDDPYDRLRAAIDELAAVDAADLLAEARIEARSRIRAMLTDALAHSMLEHLHGQLPERSAASSPASAAPSAAAARQARVPRAPESAPPRRAPKTTPARRAPKSTPARRAPEPVPTPPADTGPGLPAWYVYGVISSDAELPPSPAAVDPEQPVTILREGALAAVASQVPLEEFDETHLREHLADMIWVEATARAHEAVLEHIREHATVIPMRMCTVYRTEGGVREMLHREADALADAIGYLAGKAEWGVKAFVAAPHGGTDADAGGGSPSGAAYMQRMRDDKERRERAMEIAEEAVAEIHVRLSALADDAHEIPLQRPEVSGHAGEMILNGVYLVHDEALERFHEEVRVLRAEFDADGIELLATGPWPAYNFIPGTIGAAW